MPFPTHLLSRLPLRGSVALLAWTGAVLWALALFGGPLVLQAALLLCIAVLSRPVAVLEFGPWGLLSFLTIPLCCLAVIRQRRPRWSLALSILLPCTSPGFWRLVASWRILSDPDFDSWQPCWYFAALASSLLAALLAWIAPETLGRAQPDTGAA